jgi:hypothetical protein
MQAHVSGIYLQIGEAMKHIRDGDMDHWWDDKRLEKWKGQEKTSRIVRSHMDCPGIETRTASTWASSDVTLT